ncbi:c-type cytochrome [Sphingobacterium sp. HJSM2_6]|uniref:c-type cytochrome n=1 Tax=Sphingobacterium sp. HJSM2_6 TaxID=3366264 RepID=UPI003BD26C3A
MIENRNAKLLLFSLLMLLFAGSCTDQEAKKEVAKEDDNPKTKKIVLPEGFAIDHIYSPSDNKVGSWVSMTFDDKGRLITSDQYGSLYRIDLPPIGADSTVKPKIEKMDFPNENPADTTKKKVGMGFAQGLLYANNSLYVVVNHNANDEFSKGSGVYRLEDTNKDDQFDKISLLLAMNGEGEHGPHSIIQGPDSAIYVVAGNHTDVPQMSHYKLPANWKHDNLFPQIVDPQGHATDRKEPGGWIAKSDAEGKNWELVSGGYRNPYDIAFNDDGELFTYDSDMEWDFGMPWYRPTRISHVTSGSEYGWRTGNAKWDPSYLDNLPALLNIGQGSPTNLLYASKAKFPDQYRKSLLAFDWSFGIIYSIQLTPKGATYEAKAEEFISGSPLPLTDGVIGPDGALYFLTGGRRLESDLYRVYYTGSEKINERKVTDADDLSKDFKLRREIEQYHKPSPAGTVEKVWEHLGHEDRFIRYAARIAVEHQPVETWRDLVFKERNVVRLTEAALALARNSDAHLRDDLLRKLGTIDASKLNNRMLLNLLRVYEVIIARMGKPEGALNETLIAKLAPLYPTQNNTLNRSLGKVLVAIHDKSVVEKTVPLIASAKDDTTNNASFMSSSNLILRNPQYGLDIADMLANIPPAQQIYLATMLSTANAGWTPELHEQYFNWFYKAFGYKGGNSYIGFIDRARKIALERLPEDQRAHYGKLSGDSLVNESGKRLADKVPGPKGPGRGWGVDSALKYIDTDQDPRNFTRGSELFLALKCGACHTMKGAGGSFGPDLTQLASRFSKKDILEAIIEPSKVISDQYESKLFTMKDGTTSLGRQVGEDEQNYIIVQNPYAPQVTKSIPKNDVASVKASDVSIMPPGTLNVLSPDELRDLMAYLLSGGNENNEVYTKNKK